MELEEAIEKLKNLQDWYEKGNMSATIESSELESICIVSQALEQLQKENRQLRESRYKTILKINERCNVFNGKNFADDAIKNELEKLKREIVKMINEQLKGE